jgi:muramoyltetrapeptide carboxypeptidase
MTGGEQVERQMMRPRALQPGDRIAVVAPASGFRRDEFERGVAELQRLGFSPVWDDSIFAQEGGYLAGSAATRLKAFLRYWEDPSVAALIAVRGGYGSVHLLPGLPAARLRGQPKLFIGYSDTTSLLSWLTCQCGIPALHGPMLEGRLAHGTAGYDESSFLALLYGGDGLALSPDGVESIRHGEAAGPLFGGTLAQLTASLGTPYAFDPPDGCVLFLEDVNERPYRLDRMLTQLALAGILRRARAVIFGEMRGCDEAGGTPSAFGIADLLTRDVYGPVIFGFPSGHTAGPCWTLPFGVRVRVATEPRPVVVVEESPVS